MKYDFSILSRQTPKTTSTQEENTFSSLKNSEKTNSRGNAATTISSVIVFTCLLSFSAYMIDSLLIV